MFAREGLGYRYVNRGVVFRASRLKWTGGELFGVVEVTADCEGLPSFLSRQRVNMTGGTGRTSFAKQLADRSGGALGYEYAAWLALLESLFVRVGDAESQGSPLEWVGEDELDLGVPHVVERLVESDGINVLYGPGDQGKSWVALYLRVCVQLGIKPFGSLDVRQMETLAVEYEASSATYARRLRAVLRGMGLPYQAMRLWQPSDALPRQIEALARLVADEQIGFYTIDSAGHAAGSPGEHGSWEDAALALGKSLKVQLPAVPLLIDHTTAEGSAQKLAGRAGGAYRKKTDARVMWECRKAQEQENTWSLIGLYHAKGNNSITWKPMGIRLSFESDVWGRATAVRFERDDEALHLDAEHGQRASLRDRIKATLEGEMTAYQLAQAVGESVDSISAKLREMRGRGETRTVESVLGGRGKAARWVLTNPNTSTRLKEYTEYSGLGGMNPTPPKPITRTDVNPNDRVNGTDPLPINSGEPVVVETGNEDEDDVPY